MKISKIQRLVLKTIVAIGSLHLSAFADIGGLAIGNYENLYVSESVRGFIKSFSPDGKWVATLNADELVGNRGIALDSARTTLYFANSAKGIFTLQTDGLSAAQLFINIGGNQSAVVVDNVGNVYAGTEEGILARVDPRTRYIMKVIDGNFTNVASLTYNRQQQTPQDQQTIYFIATDKSSGIKKVWRAMPQESDTYLVEPIISSELQAPKAVVADRQGQFLYVSDAARGTISKYTTEGKFVSVVIEGHPNVSAIAVDHGNNVYFAVGDAIYKFDSNAKQIKFFVNPNVVS